jgi:hypothetical protein
MAETLVLTKVAMSARENAARLEGEVSARRGRRWWGRLVAPRRANAQRPAENVSDRFAAARSYLNGKTDLQARQRGVRNALFLKAFKSAFENIACSRRPAGYARRRAEDN